MFHLFAICYTAVGAQSLSEQDPGAAQMQVHCSDPNSSDAALCAPYQQAKQQQRPASMKDGGVYIDHARVEPHGGLWPQSFEATPFYPGDTIVVPEKPIKASGVREVIDWSQLFTNFVLGAAGLAAVVK